MLGSHEEMMDDLLESGASLTAKSTTLLPNRENGMVQLLMLKGADEDARDAGARTTLQTAARYGHVAADLD